MQSTNESETLMTLSELSKYLRVHLNTIRRWIKEKNIPHYRAGIAYRFKRQEIEEWLKR